MSQLRPNMESYVAKTAYQRNLQARRTHDQEENEMRSRQTMKFAMLLAALGLVAASLFVIIVTAHAGWQKPPPRRP